MNNVIGLINLTNESEFLQDLSPLRCPAAMHFAGSYRLVDFVLSNLVNSGIHNIAIFTGTNSESLLDHLESVQDWDLNRKRGGMYIFQHPHAAGSKYGDVQYIFDHLDYFDKSHEEYVIVSGGMLVYNHNYRSALEAHKSSGADITFLIKENYQNPTSLCRSLKIQPDGRVISLNCGIGLSTQGLTISLETYILKKSLMLELLAQCLFHGHTNLLRDGIIANLPKLKVLGFAVEGYLGIANTFASYFRHNMELLNPLIYRELFLQSKPIKSKTKNDSATRYGSASTVSNCLISKGCLIDGKVENSILFRGVKVRSGAVVKNSIILPKTEIGSKAYVENAFLDKEVRILNNRTIRGNEEAVVIGKRSVV